MATPVKAGGCYPVSSRKTPINRDGSKGATTDIDVITKWFTERPFTNIGIATGRESFFVVDVDMKNGKNGWASLSNVFGDSGVEIDDEHDLLAMTASGGMHILYRYPPGMEVCNAVNVLDGVDIRGNGGYIVAAPSTVKIGEKYVGYDWFDPGGEVPEARPWALRLLEMKPLKLRASTGNAVSSVGAAKSACRSHVLQGVTAGFPEGSRDDGLWKLACSCASKDVPIDRALVIVADAAAMCIPPFDVTLGEEKVWRAYQEYATPEAFEVALKRIDDELTTRRGNES